MPRGFDEIAARLVTAGLLRAEEIEALKLSPYTNGQPADAQGLTDRLLSNGRVTKYQADVVLHDLSEPLLLGDYLVLDRIGEGGMGQVYKARHLRMNRVVALKLVSSRKLGDPTTVKRFQREVQAAGRLTHPNIVASLDAREQNGRHYLVMEYVEGGNLAALVAKHGPLAVDLAVNCVLQVARGLEYAHAQGIVHRDIKPSNLLLDHQGTVKILDLGLARFEVEGPEDELTGTGSIMGTVDFMAPEQAIDTKHADERADVYSLGCTLYYLVAGRKPFDADSALKKVMAHREQPIPSLSGVRSDAPAALDRLLRQLLAKLPEDRIQSMSEVCRALEGLLPDSVGSLGKTSEFRSTDAAKKGAGGADAAPAPTAVPTKTLPEGPASGPQRVGLKLGRLWIAGAAVVVPTIVVVAWRSSNTARDSGVPTSVPVNAAAASPIGEPAAPVVLSEYDIARWIVRNGGRVAPVDSEIQPADFVRSAEALSQDIQIGGVLFTPDAPIGDADLERLTHLRRLSFLNLHGTPITNAGCEHLARISTLANLYLGETKIDAAGLRQLRSLTKLKFLNVVGLPIDDDLLREWPIALELTTLHAAATNIGDAGLGVLERFPKLQILGLENTQVSDEGLAKLHGRKSLTRILVANTKVTQTGADALRQSISGIQIEGIP